MDSRDMSVRYLSPARVTYLTPVRARRILRARVTRVRARGEVVR
jgi:hypothetical protein